jgi:AraC-like DNA-binding protein/mannose-6-phosphate isomerase-like protein (cupin superfamily)
MLYNSAFIMYFLAMENQIKIWPPHETDPAATTLAFNQVLECYPELPYFIRIGGINTRHAWAYTEHLHEKDHELILIHSGRVRVWIDDRDFIAGPGDSYFVLPGQRHREESVGPGLRFTFMNFTLWTTTGPNGKLAESDQTTHRQRLRDTEGTLAATLAQITREVKLARHGAFEIVNAAILQLLWHLRRRLEIVRLADPSSGVTNQQRRIVHQASLYLQLHSAEAVSLARLSRHCGLSPDYLWHLFKKVKKTTPLQYALQVRMIEAARLLRQTDLTSRQVAEKLGFRDAGYFSRAFTRHTGFTPTRYRRHRGAALPGEIPAP